MNILSFYETLPANERLIVDVLRQLVRSAIPGCREKFSWGVPCFFRRRSICIIWPASVPRGGFKEGVLFGFSHGNLLKDPGGYLHRGTNKQVYYRIYKDVDEIDFDGLERLLKEADELDSSWRA